MRVAMLVHKSVEFDSRVRRAATALARRGHDVVVLELAPALVGADRLDGFERRSVLPPAWIHRRLPSSVYRPLMLLWFVRGLLAVRPDVVHAHDAAMLLPGIVGARLTRARLVYDSHELATSVPYRERGWAWFVGAIERLVVPRCAAVITVSDGIAARLKSRYQLTQTPTVIRNVSDLERNGDGDLRLRLGLDPTVPLVLHQGAPAPSRGCEVLVEAVARLDGVHLAFLGDPEPGYERTLTDTIRRRGIADRVRLLPSIPLEQLLSHTAEADVGVTLLQDTCENHRLALPNKLFEYIAAGLPVVASALPETERLVGEYGVGWCVPPDSPEALAAALQQALTQRDDPELRMRLERAGTDLRWSTEQTRLLDLYRSLESGSESPSPRSVVLLVRNSVSHDSRVLRLARTAARELGSEPVVIGVASDGVPPGEVWIDGIRVRRVSLPRRPNWLRFGGPDVSPGLSPQDVGIRTRLFRIAMGGAFLLKAVAMARRLRPTLVHANDWNTMWAGIAIKALCGSGLIYDSHELWTERNGRWESSFWLSASELLFVRFADQVITTSPGHAGFLAGRYRIKQPLVIRNIPEWKSTAERPLHHPPVVTYIGGLLAGRGLEQMIDALPYVPEVRLRAVGPGRAAYRSRLAGRAEALGVGDRVDLDDAVPPDRVERELAASAIGLCLIQPVCLSYELSLPNKLLEYAAAGVPILASRLPVMSQVIEENNLGVVVPPDDPSSIAEGIRRLLDPERRSGMVAALHDFADANPWTLESAKLGAVYARLYARRAGLPSVPVNRDGGRAGGYGDDGAPAGGGS